MDESTKKYLAAGHKDGLAGQRNKEDLPWVAEQLMRHGGREAWDLGAKLSR